MSEEGQIATSIPMSTESSAPAAASYSEPTERMLPQSKVDELVGHVRKETREKVRSEFESQRNSSPQEQQSSMGGMPQMTQEQLHSMVEQAVTQKARQLEEQSHQKAQEQYVNEVITNFSNKISGANEKYGDFEQKVSDLDLSTIPRVIPLVNGIDNTADVMYALAENPIWAYNLEDLAAKNPKAAQTMLQRLSDSVKQNQDALGAKKANEPLSHIRSSTTAVDNGSRTVSDLRKMKHLKG